MMAIDSNNSQSSFVTWQRAYKNYYLNEQGRAIDNMGGTIGGDASSGRQVCACA